MKKLIILIVLLTLVFFGFWASVLKNSRKHLEFDHSSESVLHLKEKKVFVNDLYIANPDSIK